MLDTQLGRKVLEGTPSVRAYETWPDDAQEAKSLLQEHNVKAAVVVLNQEIAANLLAADCPVIYVDTIPFIWGPEDPLPRAADAYCAQHWPALPDLAQRAMESVANLTWINPIVPAATEQQRDPGMTLISLGGLNTPANPTGDPEYMELVIPPTMRALAEAGKRLVQVCGNVDAAQVERLIPDLPLDVTIARKNHDEFLDALATCGLLVTSPGLITMLEAARVNTPAICLPPHNLSGILQIEQFAVAIDERICVNWPSRVIDREQIERTRAVSQEQTLQLIDGGIDNADPSLVHPQLQATIGQAIQAVPDIPRWNGLIERGTDGASQVARIVGRILSDAGISVQRA